MLLATDRAEFLVRQGYDVYMIDWGVPREADRHRTQTPGSDSLAEHRDGKQRDEQRRHKEHRRGAS